MLLSTSSSSLSILKHCTARFPVCENCVKHGITLSGHAGWKRDGSATRSTQTSNTFLTVDAPTPGATPASRSCLSKISPLLQVGSCMPGWRPSRGVAMFRPTCIHPRHISNIQFHATI
ncbi:hypothetical protein P280DRAFT_198802 [Massarina eburnea CBS 473.64]|uniref:Uncharacterized protein n=1 Tax=Massarina eburnea CBS 473.64 TaxID=1395130 RepID=A0A6A6RHW5_9PLEO|nr:hypothetical protein P280DRAFT_198802 [Massarina eburnea CBS 473.64]